MGAQVRRPRSSGIPRWADEQRALGPRQLLATSRARPSLVQKQKEKNWQREGPGALKLDNDARTPWQVPLALLGARALAPFSEECF